MGGGGGGLYSCWWGVWCYLLRLGSLKGLAGSVARSNLEAAAMSSRDKFEVFHAPAPWTHRQPQTKQLFANVSPWPWPCLHTKVTSQGSWCCRSVLVLLYARLTHKTLSTWNRNLRLCPGTWLYVHFIHDNSITTLPLFYGICLACLSAKNLSLALNVYFWETTIYSSTAFSVTKRGHLLPAQYSWRVMLRDSTTPWPSYLYCCRKVFKWCMWRCDTVRLLVLIFLSVCNKRLKCDDSLLLYGCNEEQL